MYLLTFALQMLVIDYGVHVTTTFKIITFLLVIHNHTGLSSLALRIRHMSIWIKHKTVA